MQPSYMRRWRPCRLANSRSLGMALTRSVCMPHHPVTGSERLCRRLLSAPVSVPPTARLFPFAVRARTNNVGFAKRHVGLGGRLYLLTDLSPNATQNRNMAGRLAATNAIGETACSAAVRRHPHRHSPKRTILLKRTQNIRL